MTGTLRVMLLFAISGAPAMPMLAQKQPPPPRVGRAAVPQQPPPAGRAAGRPALLRQVQEKFLDNAIKAMQLSSDQQPMFRRVVMAYNQKRLVLDQEEHRLVQERNTAGATVDTGLVAKNVDMLAANRVAYTQTYSDENQELKRVLTPAQRAKFQRLDDQFQQRVAAILQQRPVAGGSAPAVTPPHDSSEIKHPAN